MYVNDDDVSAHASPKSRWSIAPGSVSENLSTSRTSDARRGSSSADDDRDEIPTKATPKRPAVPGDGGRRRAPINAPSLGSNRELRSPQGVGHSPAAILAGSGGVLLIVITTAVGAIIDFLVSGAIGLFGAIGLSVGAAFAALITRKRDLLSVLVAPPIVYAVIGGLVLMVSSRPVNVTSVAQLAINGFPAMAIATGLAAVIVGIKLLTTRVGERR